MNSSNPSVRPTGQGESAEYATRILDIGGRRLAMNCSGQGTPTVILETGLGAESSDWAAVQRGLSEVTRVFRYDRAGRGASDPAPRPRNARDMVDDLHALLRIAEIPGPYILVGHSLGGLLMRLYAHLHPDRTAGLVLVDSMHEDQFDVFGPLFPPSRSDDPPALRDVRAFWTAGWRDPASTVEGIDFPSSLAQARTIKSLGDIPLHILTAGTFLNQPLIPQAGRPGLQRRWDGLQVRFKRLSSRVTQSSVATSGHFVQREDPDRVIEAIKAMIQSLRSAKTP